MKKRLSGFAFVGASSALAALGRGYTFPHGNHGQEIPPIMAVLDPSLFQSDLAVQSFLGPGPRFVYQQLIAALVRAGLDYPAAYALFYFVSLVSLVAGCVALGRHLSSLMDVPKTEALVVGGGLTALLLLPAVSWGSRLFDTTPIPSTFAMGFAIWGVYFSTRRRWIPAYLNFAAASLLQFLVGFLGGVAVGVAFLWDTVERRKWRTVAVALAVWGFALSVVAIPIMLAGASKAPPTFDFVEDFGLYRVPHHWAPSTGSARAWLSDAGLALTTVLIARELRGISRLRAVLRLSVTGVLVAATAVLVNYVFVEIYPIAFIGKLQLQRLIPFGHLLAYILVLALAVRMWQQRRLPPLVLLTVSPFLFLPGVMLLVAVLIYRTFASFRGHLQWLTVAAAVGSNWLLAGPIGGGHTSVPTALGGLAYAPGQLLPLLIMAAGILSLALLMTVIRPPASAIIGTAAATSLVALFGILASEPGSNLLARAASSFTDRVDPEHLDESIEQRWSLDRRPLPGQELAVALRDAAGKDDITIVPPLFNTVFESIQFLSGRSVYFVHKNVPYTEPDLWIWVRRAEALLGTELRPFMTEGERREAFARRSTSELVALARREGACFIVSEESWHGAEMPGAELARESYGQDTWILWKLEHCGGLAKPEF